jgi:hypothetical protein
LLHGVCLVLVVNRPWLLLLLLRRMLLMLLLMLLLLLLMLHTEHFGVNLALGWATRSHSRRRGLPRPAPIFIAAAFVKMDKLLMADK